MEHPELDDDGRMSAPNDDRVGDHEMDHDELGVRGGRDSPLKPILGGFESGEDILAKLRQHVSSTSYLSHHNNNIMRDDHNGTSPSRSPPNSYFGAYLNNNNNNGHNIYNRLQSLIQSKMKGEEDTDMEDDTACREMALRAEVLQKQREALLSSPHALANALRGGMPPSLVHSNHMPFLPNTVGLPPSSQMPPTPGSGGSRESSGNGARTPSHTPEPSQSQQPWNFEEQFKQVRAEDYGITDVADNARVREPAKHSSFEEDKKKLYELSSDPKRKEFLDELFSFMAKRTTPVNRLPIMAKQVLDLYELYNLVVERGGLVDVINKKLWQEIIKGLKLPSSITSAAFTLRTQYMKYLYPFECEKKGFSNPSDLQCAIDGNRRESRRSNYGAYGDLIQPPLLPLSGIPGLQSLQNPLSLMAPRPQLNGGPHPAFPPELLGRPGSPPSSDALLEATRMTMWKFYNQNLANHGVAGVGHDDDAQVIQRNHLGGPTVPPQKEALNLEVKEELVSPAEPWHCFQRPNIGGRDNGDLRHGKNEESNNQPSKRLASCEDSPPGISNCNGPSTPTGANIKITSRGGDGRNQDPSLVVSMELNGMLYQGILFANQHNRMS